MPPQRLNDDPEAELAYLRRQLDETAAATFALNSRATAATNELELRRRGFSLLAGLGGSLGAHTEIEPALGSVLPAMAAKLNVQRTVALRRSPGGYTPFAWTGYRPEEVVRLAEASIDLPDELVRRGVCVTRSTGDQGWVSEARARLMAPVFVVAPVGGGDHALAVGRLDERSGFFPRFAAADVDALTAVGELVQAAVRNTQVAALNEVRRFLPPSVLQEVMSGRLLADGGHERRQVTLLAADMVGFTQMAESLPPDSLAFVLNAYLRDMTTLAHAHGGTVGSIAGDGVLLIFGAPETSTPAEQALAAVEAAFAMQARMPVLAEEARAEGADVDLRIRVGINTGRCAVGVFGSDTQRTYSAIGLPVNVAARLESAAGPGETLVSPSTLELLGGRARTEARGALSLKGIAEPVGAHAILSPAA